jgi:adenylate cyclase
MAQAETRKLAAIMFTDIVGFSHQMGADEARMLRLLEIHNQLIQHAVSEHHGHVIKTMGDAFVVDFPSVVNAVQCAQRVQGHMRAHNAEKEKPEQIHVRIGIHLGDIVVQPNGDVLGDGVNIASRLQTLAAPDTICISQKVYEEVEKKLPLGAVISLGRPRLKNIAQRQSIYALLPEQLKGVRQLLRVQRLKLSRRVGTAHRVVALVGLLALVSAGTLLIRNRYFPSPSGLPLPDKPSIVVLPFTNISGDPQQEYFSDGITEDLTTDLSKFSGLFVIARNSAFTYKGKAVKVQDVSRELGVRYALEGSVRKADSQVRITAQLIDTPSGQHLWAERYDRELKDIFALQDEITRQIVANLRVEVGQAELERARRTPTENLTAYDYVLRGREAFLRASLDQTQKEANAQARQLFEKAIELDPAYAEAYTWLGYTYLLERIMVWNLDPQTLERAGELAQKAIALDDSLPRPHLLLGQVYRWKKQHEQAIAEVERALALDPNSDYAYVNLGDVLFAVGRPEETIGLVEKAMHLNPRYPVYYLQLLGQAYGMTGRYEEAIATLKRVVTLNPNFFPAHLVLASCYVELGRLAEAQAAAAEVLRINPNFSLEVERQTSGVKDPAAVEHWLTTLRKAGLK